MDKISVIIPAYNSQPWIERCLRSIINAADNACEIIVADDGSTDATPDIVSGFSVRDSRVKLVRITHQGPGAARKAALATASGQWISFVDSDDTIPADSIALLRELISQDIDIIVGNVIIRGPQQSRLADSGSPRTISPQQFVIELLEHRLLNVCVGKLIRRHLFDIVDWDTHISLTNHEDAMLAIKLACAASKNIIIVPNRLAYHYILRPQSQSASLHLTFEGIQRLWDNIKTLPAPKESIARWGLGLIRRALIDRGVEFPNSYPPARELRKMSRHLKLGPMHRPVAIMLYSQALRRFIMRRHLKDGTLTMLAPHLAFIIPVKDRISGLMSTVRSILNTGLRNIEIIIIDDSSKPKNSIKIHELQINYKRIRVIKSPHAIGPSQARRLGVKNATAFCITFLTPGDKAFREGLFQSVVNIDRGADIALSASRLCPTPPESPDSLIRQSLLNPAAPSPLTGLTIRKNILKDEDFDIPATLNDTHTTQTGQIYTLISLLTRPGAYSMTPEIGHTHAPRTEIRGKSLMSRTLDIAPHAAALLAGAGMADIAGTLSCAIKNTLISTAATMLANPLHSIPKISEQIKQTLTHPATLKTFNISGIPLPSSEQIITLAQTQLRDKPMLRLKLLFTPAPALNTRKITSQASCQAAADDVPRQIP